MIFKEVVHFATGIDLVRFRVNSRTLQSTYNLVQRTSFLQYICTIQSLDYHNRASSAALSVTVDQKDNFRPTDDKVTYGIEQTWPQKP